MSRSSSNSLCTELTNTWSFSFTTACLVRRHWTGDFRDGSFFGSVQGSLCLRNDGGQEHTCGTKTCQARPPSIPSPAATREQRQAVRHETFRELAMTVRRRWFRKG